MQKQLFSFFCPILWKYRVHRCFDNLKSKTRKSKIPRNLLIHCLTSSISSNCQVVQFKENLYVFLMTLFWNKNIKIWNIKVFLHFRKPYSVWVYFSLQNLWRTTCTCWQMKHEWKSGTWIPKRQTIIEKYIHLIFALKFCSDSWDLRVPVLHPEIAWCEDVKTTAIEIL